MPPKTQMASHNMKLLDGHALRPKDAEMVWSVCIPRFSARRILFESCLGVKSETFAKDRRCRSNEMYQGLVSNAHRCRIDYHNFSKGFKLMKCKRWMVWLLVRIHLGLQTTATIFLLHQVNDVMQAEVTNDNFGLNPFVVQRICCEFMMDVKRNLSNLFNIQREEQMPFLLGYYVMSFDVDPGDLTGNQQIAVDLMKQHFTVDEDEVGLFILK